MSQSATFSLRKEGLCHPSGLASRDLLPRPRRPRRQVDTQNDARAREVGVRGDEDEDGAAGRQKLSFVIIVGAVQHVRGDKREQLRRRRHHHRPRRRDGVTVVRLELPARHGRGGPPLPPRPRHHHGGGRHEQHRFGCQQGNR